MPAKERFIITAGREFRHRVRPLDIDGLDQRRMRLLSKLTAKNIRLAAAGAIVSSLLIGCTTSNGVSGPGVQLPQLSRSPTSVESELMYEVLSAELAGRRGMLGIAAENYLSASKKTDDARVAERATKLAIFGRNWKHAQDAGKRWAELAPENLESHQILGQIQLNQSNVKGATDAFAGLVENSDDIETGMRTAVSTLLHDTNYRAALEVAGNLLDLHPTNAMIHFGVARLQLSNGHKQEALEAVDQSLSYNPESGDAILLKGQILSEMGRAQEGYGYVRSRVSALPDNLMIRLGLARMLVRAELYDEASREFDGIAKLAPDNANAMFTLGLLALESRRTDAAAGYLERVLELGQHESDSHYYLGRIADNRQEYQVAIEHYDQVRQGDNVLDAKIRSAEIRGATGDLDLGRQQLQRLRMVSTDPQVQVRLILSEGRLLREADRYTESLAVFNEGLEGHPENVELLYAHALTAEHLGMDEAFERDLRKVIELEPENAHALNALGYFLVDRGQRLDEAEVYLNKAISLLPEDPAIIDSLGWLNYRKGNYDEALVLLRKAFGKLVDPEIAAHLGEVLWVTGDEKSATEIWNKGLEVQPNDGLLRGVMERYIQ